MNKKTKTQIEKIANNNDWSVSFCNERNNEICLEFMNCTPYGQDLIVTIWMPTKGTIEDLASKIYEYADAYDPDYEASLWRGDDGHGKNGAPYRISDIVEDMEDAEQMIYDLADAFKEA